MRATIHGQECELQIHGQECELQFMAKNVNHKFLVSHYKKKASKERSPEDKVKDAQVEENSEITETTAKVERSFDSIVSVVEPAPKKGHFDVFDYDKSAALEATVVQKPDDKPSTKLHTETGQFYFEGPSFTDNKSNALSERQLSEIPIKAED